MIFLLIWLFLEFSFVNLSILHQENKNIQKNIVGSYQAWLWHSLSLPLTGEKQSQAEAQCSGWCPLATCVLQHKAVKRWHEDVSCQGLAQELFFKPLTDSYFFKLYKFVFLFQCLAERQWSGLQGTSVQGKLGVPSLRLSSCPASAQWLWLLGEMVLDPRSCSESRLYKDELPTTRNKVHWVGLRACIS